jgi:hypothetical protein
MLLLNPRQKTIHKTIHKIIQKKNPDKNHLKSTHNQISVITINQQNPAKRQSPEAIPPLKSLRTRRLFPIFIQKNACDGGVFTRRTYIRKAIGEDHDAEMDPAVWTRL